MRTDVFPTTQALWIQQRLAEGDDGLAELNRFIMTVYARPLKVYFLGSRDRRLGEPDDVIDGFFASRLKQPEFLARWKSSGIRLRRWLMNGLCFYLKELHTEQRRQQRLVPLDDEPMQLEDEAAREGDRQFVVELVREALRMTAAACDAADLSEHWNVFVQHHQQGMPYDKVACQIGVARPRAEVMGRTAARKFRAVVRELLERDGVPPQDVDREIELLLEAMT